MKLKGVAFMITTALAGYAGVDNNPKDFSGECEVFLTGVGSTSYAGCRFVDTLSTAGPGFNNAFEIRVGHTIDFHVSPVARYADYVSVSCLPDGAMLVSSVLLGVIHIVPYSDELKKMFRGVAYEVRPQNVSIVNVGPGEFTIRIDEPCEDFNGVVPSVNWVLRFMSAQKEKGRAH